MAIPKFSELSTPLQTLVILVVGAALWGVTEYVILKPVSDGNTLLQNQASTLERDLIPLRSYEQKQKQLVEENHQLELQLATLRQIVPDENEVDGFVRLIYGTARTAGVEVRRFTSKPVVPQDYYAEVPFEVELDGPYFQVLGFFQRVGHLERIVNVSDLKMGGIQANKSVGNKQYVYSPNETIVAVCTITSFFSREEALPEKPASGKPGQPPAAQKK